MAMLMMPVLIALPPIMTLIMLVVIRLAQPMLTRSFCMIFISVVSFVVVVHLISSFECICGLFVRRSSFIQFSPS